MSSRFFKTNRNVYDAARESLDVTFGHPNGKAETCLPPEPLVNSEGEVILALLTSMTEWPEVTPMIAGLLESGQVTEITREEYTASFPETP